MSNPIIIRNGFTALEGAVKCVSLNITPTQAWEQGEIDGDKEWGWGKQDVIDAVTARMENAKRVYAQGYRGRAVA